MKIIKQFGIIFSICWISTLIEHLLPFSFPASVIGMILLFICLLTGILKIDHIREKSDISSCKYGVFLYPCRSKCYQLFGYSESELASAASDLYSYNHHHFCSNCLQRSSDHAPSCAQKRRLHE